MTWWTCLFPRKQRRCFAPGLSVTTLAHNFVDIIQNIMSLPTDSGVIGFLLTSTKPARQSGGMPGNLTDVAMSVDGYGRGWTRPQHTIESGIRRRIRGAGSVCVCGGGDLVIPNIGQAVPRRAVPGPCWLSVTHTVWLSDMRWSHPQCEVAAPQELLFRATHDDNDLACRASPAQSTPRNVGTHFPCCPPPPPSTPLSDTSARRLYADFPLQACTSPWSCWTMVWRCFHSIVAGVLAG